jgi:hypothetical protein
VDIGAAGWVRLLIDQATLIGDSYLRITSHQDGGVQTLSASDLEDWAYTTAYFNGPAVTVEVLAAPGTTGNSVSIVEVWGPGSSTLDPLRVCVTPDLRGPSSDPRTARLLSPPVPPGGIICTGYIINRAPANDLDDACMLTAGHCIPANTTVVQFEPIGATNSATCALAHPPPSKQFAMNPATIRSENAGPGDDWAVFRVHRNVVTGKTNLQEQGSAYSLGFPGKGAATKFGYGLDGPANADPNVTHCACVAGNAASAASGTQQTHTAAITGVLLSGRVNHNIHDCGGDSGEPIVQGGMATAIGTAGACSGGPANSGTSVQVQDLQDAIDEVCPNIPINIDHYKVYDNVDRPPPIFPVTLVDQFGPKFGVVVGPHDLWANPVDKNNEGMRNPIPHQTWWAISQPGPWKKVGVWNQFGDFVWDVGDAQYLVLPASKGVCSGGLNDMDECTQLALDPCVIGGGVCILPAVPDDAQHYTCYAASGPDVNLQAFLADQFETEIVDVMSPALLCTPTEKRILDEITRVLHPADHMTCYTIDDPTQTPIPLFDKDDQFGLAEIDIIGQRYLCTPARKLELIPTLGFLGLTLLGLALFGVVGFRIAHDRGWIRRTHPI